MVAIEHLHTQGGLNQGKSCICSGTSAGAGVDQICLSAATARVACSHLPPAPYCLLRFMLVATYLGSFTCHSREGEMD